MCVYLYPPGDGLSLSGTCLETAYFHRFLGCWMNTSPTFPFTMLVLLIWYSLLHCQQGWRETTLLITAAEEGQSTLVEQLLLAGADIEADDWVNNCAWQNLLCGDLAMDLSLTMNSYSPFLYRQESSCPLCCIHDCMYGRSVKISNMYILHYTYSNSFIKKYEYMYSFH